MNTLKRTLILASTAALLSACAVGPQFERPAAPSVDRYTTDASAPPLASTTRQQVETGAAVPADWWRLFESPQLNQLVDQAQQRNQTLAAAQATLAQSQALVEAKTGTRYPQVDLTAGTGRQQYGAQFLGPMQTPPFTYFAFGAAVSYTLDYTGGVGRAIERQQALAEYQARELQATHLSVTGNVVQRTIEVAAAQAEIEALQEVLADDRRNLDMIRDAYAAGSVSRVDVLSAESQLASDETLLPPLRQRLSVARHGLAVLAGELPPNANFTAPALGELTLPARLPVNVPSELVHGRPDILAAEAQLRAATAAVGVATANLYPRITLSATVGQQALETSELFDSKSTAWGLIVGLTAPVFDGGKLRAERRAALAALSVQSAKYQQVVLESFGQVADALDALDHGAEQLDAQSRALDVARQNLDLTRESYNEGNTGVLQVLDSERLYQQARLGFVRAQAQRLQDTARLFVALGGGTPDQSVSVASR
ncbi:MAG TPA: efflux transporter outer membrane subunit [Povalibacter sp.]|uniref:efflux transporter outer membrane subunit n=1 Tax=Povalibacter sp. TaxID=1962978 RepID=UPI002BC91E67|nr:efflux transporter outer membrane subunit [Povalibacter sp.]HMN46816.1 efflux transporter outer membrane subunit [Povalibacter sp.]